MAKQLNFEFEGKEYTLEFTRRTVQRWKEKGSLYRMWSVSQ